MSTLSTNIIPDLLLAVRIRAMLSTVAEVRHVLCPNCVERSTQQGRSESLEAKTLRCGVQKTMENMLS